MNKTKTPIEIALDGIDFKATDAAAFNPDGLPYVTHEGILQLGEIAITVFVLSTGERIIPADEIERIFGTKIGSK